MPDPNIKKVVMIVPGIRDYGTWIETASDSFKEVDEDDTVRVWPVRAGYFSVFKFLAPRPVIDYYVGQRVQILADACKAARTEYPNAQLSFIGHSFGTDIITQFLKRHDSEKAEYLILCGSVVNRRYKFEEISDRVGNPGEETKKYLYNDCGNADPWPTVGARAGWIFGDIGTNGGPGGLVTNRVFNGGHSFFNNKKYMKRYWANLVINGDDNQQQSPLQLREGLAWYVKVLEKLPLNWMIAAIIASLFALAIWSLVSISGCAADGPDPPIPDGVVDIKRLEEMEANRLKVVKAQEGKHAYETWDEAFLSENKSLIDEIEQSVEAQNRSIRDVFLVAAPAASGKGKLARIVRDKFEKTSIKIRYDRSLSDQEGVDDIEYHSIPVVESWSFKLPKPASPAEIAEQLIRTQLADKKIPASNVQLLIVDGIDEIHPETREPLIKYLAGNGQSLLEGFEPRTVVFFGRAEGYIEYFKENKEEKSSVRARSLVCPIPSCDKESHAAWDDFERWELRVAPKKTDPDNPIPTEQLPLRDDKISASDVVKANAVFLNVCKDNLRFR